MLKHFALSQWISSQLIGASVGPDSEQKTLGVKRDVIAAKMTDTFAQSRHPVFPAAEHLKNVRIRGGKPNVQCS